MATQHVGAPAVDSLTYQCQVWQFAQALAFVEHPLPLVADGV